MANDYAMIFQKYKMYHNYAISQIISINCVVQTSIYN